MTLSSGTTLSLYEIIAPIGAGGMGEVYRARDTKLDRDVAIKVLPELFSRDPERVRRFQREAKVLASLNHPNIAAIYGFEVADKKNFLVMELVEGETLSQRLKVGSMQVEESLSVGKQICEALEAAHERGVIHRDLKPANVMIREDGTVKVLDFGLAKAMAEESPTFAADSPTITANYTRPGVVLGTAAYMSPEQARGRPLDKRTDIWSFGIILFECLTGVRLFQGETANDSMGAIMHKEPEWSLLPPGIPPTIQLLLRRCLTKDRKRRLHDIADARIELDAATRDPTGTELGLATALDAPRRPSARIGRLVGAAILGATITAIGLLSTQTAEQQPLVRKYSIPVARVQDFWNTPTSVISPDGSRIAYIQDGKLWGRDLKQLDARSVPDSEGAASPFWSPDSMSVGFFDLQALEIRTFNFADGTIRSVCTLPRSWPWATATWGEEDTIVFDRSTGLYEVEALGGEPRLRLSNDTADSAGFFSCPRFLPGGKNLLAMRRHVGGDSHVVHVQGNSATPLRGFEQSVSFIGAVRGRHLLYQRQDGKRGIWAVALSSQRDGVEGIPFRVTDSGQFPSAGSDGTLIFQSPGADQLVRVSRSGAITETIGEPSQQIMNPAVSNDGRHIAFSAIENGKNRIWVHDIDRATRVPLTRDFYVDRQPAWSPSDESIYFSSNRPDVALYEGRIGTLDVAKKAVDHELRCAEVSVSGDGKYLAFITIALSDESNLYDIWQQSLSGDAIAAPIIATAANEMLPDISPDGRYVAFMSDQTGRWEVFVASSPGGATIWGPLSTQGGIQPKWYGKDELIYVDDHGLMSVKLNLDKGFAWEKAVRVFDEQQAGVLLVDRSNIPISVRYDVDPSRESFIMVQNVSGNDTGIIVVQNWLEEFEADN